jgi:serine/threonine protein kinase
MYAMKVISREKIGSIKLQENLDSEISIMRDYRHENIVQLYDHFVSAPPLLFPDFVLRSFPTCLSLSRRPPQDTSIWSWNIVLVAIYKNILKRMRDSANM